MTFVFYFAPCSPESHQKVAQLVTRSLSKPLVTAVTPRNTSLKIMQWEFYFLTRLMVQSHTRLMAPLDIHQMLEEFPESHLRRNKAADLFPAQGELTEIVEQYKTTC